MAQVHEFVQQKKGAFIGLLVQRKYAERFFEGKVFELRSFKVNFLEVGQCIALISCGDGARRVLAILEFHGCIQIPLTQLAVFQAMHKLDNEEMASFMGRIQKKNKDHVWAWHFSLKCQIWPPLPLPNTSAEIWMHFTMEEIHAESNIQANDTSQSNSEFAAARSSSSVSLGVSSQPLSDLAVEIQEEWQVHETAVCLTKAEWACLNSGKTSCLVRGYQPTVELLLVVLHFEDLQAVGFVRVAATEKFQTANKFTEDPRLKGVYTARELRSMRAKQCLWCISEVTAFSASAPVALPRRMAVSNRPFTVRSTLLHQLAPQKADLQEIAAFFLNSLPAEQRDVIMKVGATLRGKCIRVGTTCSGSDICIPCLRSVLDVISGEAR